MKRVRPGLAAALVLLSLGCATGSTRTRPPKLSPPARQGRAGAPQRGAGPASGMVAYVPPEVARAVDAASSMVGRRSIVVDGVDYGPDCAALVRAAFAQAGRPLPDEVRDAEAVHAFASRRGALLDTRRLSPGDLVFLSDRPGGAPVHVGLVARADPDGTLLVLHRVLRGVLRVRVNLAYPEQPNDPATGKHINDTLLVGSRPVLAGSLVVGASDLLRKI
jgi:hypothetical protein